MATMRKPHGTSCSPTWTKRLRNGGCAGGSRTRTIRNPGSGRAVGPGYKGIQTAKSNGRKHAGTGKRAALERRGRLRRDRRRRGVRGHVHAAPASRPRLLGTGARGRKRGRRHLVLEPL